MSRPRVVVTGIGVVSSLGIGHAAHVEGLREGRSGIRPIQTFDSERLSVKTAGEAIDFKGEDHFERGQIAILDRMAQLGVFAAREAIEASGLSFEGETALRTATILGCAMGGLSTLDQNYWHVYHEMKNRVHPFIVPRTMSNAPTSHISMEHGLKGPAFSISTACSSANHAMGQALATIRGGLADICVTGGTESFMCFGGIKCWEGLRVMARDACRPFSANRTGMVLGEGAAILIFEELEHARARGAEILAEICGSGNSADAGDIVAPSEDGASRAIRAALADAEMSPEEVGYINAHGTATAANDRTEAGAIRAVFGDGAPPVSSTKSMHGHCIGAAGALEAVATVMALRDGVLPPTINHEEDDPAIGLDVIPNEAREAKIDAALSNSFAFGGLNAVLAFRKAP